MVEWVQAVLIASKSRRLIVKRTMKVTVWIAARDNWGLGDVV